MCVESFLSPLIFVMSVVAVGGLGFLDADLITTCGRAIDFLLSES